MTIKNKLQLISFEWMEFSKILVDISLDNNCINHLIGITIYNEYDHIYINFFEPMISST